MPKSTEKVPLSRRPSRRQINASNCNTFAYVLFDILEEGKHDCLRWSEDGKRVVVTNRNAIVRDVLPNYFTTPKFESFTRQFHVYEFHRTTDNRKAKHPDGYCEFERKNFCRGRRDLVATIRRGPGPKAVAGSRSSSRTLVQRIRESTLRDKAADHPAPQLLLPPPPPPPPLGGPAPLPPAAIATFPAEAAASTPVGAASAHATPGLVATRQHTAAAAAAGADNGDEKAGPWLGSISPGSPAGRTVAGIQEIVNNLDLLPTKVLTFVEKELGEIQRSIRRMLIQVARSAHAASTSPPAGAPSRLLLATPYAPAGAPQQALPAGVATSAAADVEPVTPIPMTAPAIRGSFFPNGLAVHDPATAAHFPESQTVRVLPPVSAHVVAQSTADILGASFGAGVPASLYGGALPPGCGALQITHTAPMAGPALPSASAGPAAEAMGLMYAPPAAGDAAQQHQQSQAQQHALSIPVFGMVQPLSLGHIGPVVPDAAAGVSSAPMAVDTAAPSSWGAAMPGHIPTSIVGPMSATAIVDPASAAVNPHGLSAGHAFGYGLRQP
ncbi:Heat shock transcription factor [Coemansia javaensis]|uniref:Heat shock transcription factor n=1 Tax=Coemansia javaensis TaxID=2761396 RepID=A0A9W8HEE5_9FUNG|nr:Heat shock transcription factor [Coemansia javaensis]